MVAKVDLNCRAHNAAGTEHGGIARAARKCARIASARTTYRARSWLSLHARNGTSSDASRKLGPFDLWALQACRRRRSCKIKKEDHACGRTRPSRALTSATLARLTGTRGLDG